MFNVCTCVWNGDRDWDNSERNVEYVNKLFRGIQRNFSYNFKFICFADRDNYSKLINEADSDIELRELDSPSWQGCLPKLKPFDKNNGFEGRVITMDLDCVIVGNLDKMFSYNGELATRRKFNGQKISGGDMIGFPAGAHSDIWDWLVDKPGEVEEVTTGRERFIYRDYFVSDFWQDMYPGQLISYKRHVRKNNERLPDNARIVSCHSNPRPHVLRDKGIEWINEHWI